MNVNASKLTPKVHSRFLVYCLVDPVTDQPRYIGASSIGLRRPKQHLSPANWKLRRTHKECWIAKLSDSGWKPNVAVLSYHTSFQEALDAEVILIASYREQGFSLTNATDGGFGVSGYRHTEEWKRDNSARLTGRKATPEHIANAKAGKAAMSPEDKAIYSERLSASMKGRVLPREAIDRMAATKRGVPSPQKGRKRTPEQNARNSAAQLGKTMSKESSERKSKSMLAKKIKRTDAHKRIMSETHKGNKYREGKEVSKETRDKISASLSGRKRSPEAIENVRIGSKAGRERSKEQKRKEGQLIKKIT